MPLLLFGCSGVFFLILNINGLVQAVWPIVQKSSTGAGTNVIAFSNVDDFYISNCSKYSLRQFVFYALAGFYGVCISSFQAIC